MLPIFLQIVLFLCISMMDKKSTNKPLLFKTIPLCIIREKNETLDILYIGNIATYNP